MTLEVTPTPRGVIVIFLSKCPQTGLVFILAKSRVAKVDAPGFASSPVVYDCLVFLIAWLSDLNLENRLQGHRGVQIA